jgi:hypothetical protein
MLFEFYPGDVVVVVVVDVLVLVEVEVVVVVTGASVVVVVVVVGLQHSFASISCQLPTFGLNLCSIKLPAMTRPVPS